LNKRLHWLLAACVALLPAMQAVAADEAQAPPAPVSREVMAERFTEHCRSTLQSQRELLSALSDLGKDERVVKAKTDMALVNLAVQENTCLCFAGRLRDDGNQEAEGARLRSDNEAFMAAMKPEFQACAGRAARPRLEEMCMLVFAAQPTSQPREQAQASCRAAAAETGAMSDLELGAHLQEAFKAFERKAGGEQAPPQS